MEVHSLQEYLSIINELMCNYTYSIQNLPNPMFGKTVYRPHFIYRGHSSCQYKLLPAIFRWHDLPQGVSVSAYSQLEFIYPGLDGIGKYINKKYSSRQTV